MSIIKKPHDKFFKETLSDIETARDFMINYLPKERRYHDNCRAAY